MMLQTLQILICKSCNANLLLVEGFQLDGGQIKTVGYNTARATADFAGGLAGAAVGVSFGGVGAIPGSIIGGAIGGIVGTVGGSWLGTEIVNIIYGM